MRIPILITNTGSYVNSSEEDLLVSSPITGVVNSSSYACQITLEFFNSITLLNNGLYVPNTSSVITTGLSGTLTFGIYASQYAPYPVSITPSGTIDISNSCILQWTGIIERLSITATSIVGCNYIRILLDRAGV